jgi:hypothetical protein
MSIEGLDVQRIIANAKRQHQEKLRSLPGASLLENEQEYGNGYVTPLTSDNPAEWRAHAFTAASLENKAFPPTSFVVPGLFPEGVTILAGRPKVGKSWMALDIALAGSGRVFRYPDGNCQITRPPTAIDQQSMRFDANAGITQ